MSSAAKGPGRFVDRRLPEQCLSLHLDLLRQHLQQHQTAGSSNSAWYLDTHTPAQTDKPSCKSWGGTEVQTMPKAYAWSSTSICPRFFSTGVSWTSSKARRRSKPPPPELMAQRPAPMVPRPLLDTAATTLPMMVETRPRDYLTERNLRGLCRSHTQPSESPSLRFIPCQQCILTRTPVRWTQRNDHGSGRIHGPIQCNRRSWSP